MMQPEQIMNSEQIPGRTTIEFQNAGLPDGWTAETFNHTFVNGELCTGANTILRIPITAHAGQCLTVELELTATAQSMIYCGDHTFTIMAEPGLGRCRLQHYGRMPMAEGAVPAISPGQPIRLVFVMRPDRWQLIFEGKIAMDAPIPATASPATMLNLGFTGDCRVRAIHLPDRPAQPTPHPPRAASKFHLEVAVDFPDDVMHAPFDRRMFDRLFDELASWGVRRCHWIYYGGIQSGWWRHCHCGGNAGAINAARTFANVGDILTTAVAAAHARDMELYGLIKPFDMGFQYSYGENSPDALQRGRLPRIGGPVDWMADFTADNRHLIMARPPCAMAAPPPLFTQIDLVKSDTAPATFTVADVELWTSTDNQHYQPYTGPMQREEVLMDYPRWEHTAAGGRPAGGAARTRVMRLKDLRIDSPYLAVCVPGQAGSFANDLLNLIHVCGPQGPTRNWTVGLTPRLTHARPDGAVAERRHGVFSAEGVEFDYAPGTPTAVFPGYNHWCARHALDSGHGFLAVARGRNPTPLATLSPHFQAARDWWLTLVRECLTSGADGVELRVRNHHSPIAWSEYGFEAPVRNEFLARHGVDIWATPDFDRAAWRRLRGEAWTEFYRAARRITRAHDRKLGLHVSQTMCLEPELAAAMDIHWDWRTWLTEGLADSVTMKEVVPGSRFAEEVLAVTRPRRIPVIFSPYANALWSRPGGVAVCDQRIRMARAHGYDGFQFYECAAVIQGSPDGQVIMRQPELRALLQRHFGKKPA